MINYSRSSSGFITHVYLSGLKERILLTVAIFFVGHALRVIIEGRTQSYPGAPISPQQYYLFLLECDLRLLIVRR